MKLLPAFVLGFVASLAHGQEIVMLPKLGVAPPITQWETEEVAIDLFHHVVYATATGIAYELLDRG